MNVAERSRAGPEDAAESAVKRCFPDPDSADLFVNGAIGVRPFYCGDEIALATATRESLNELLPWMTWCRLDYGVAQAKEFIAGSRMRWEQGISYEFCIYQLEDNLVLGSVGLNRISRSHSCANLAYWVRRTQAGRGIATAASQLAVRFAFNHLHLDHLRIMVPVDNLRSRRVAEKLGARQDSVLTQWVIIQGIVHDALMYSLSRIKG